MTDLRDPQPAAATKRQRGQGARRRLPRGCDAGRTAVAGEEGGGETTRPAGDIAIHQLFAPGVYEERVAAWMREADIAMEALRRRAHGEQVEVPHVPT
eukprot:5560735-Pleurochrysis_carterae.AAC.1